MYCNTKLQSTRPMSKLGKSLLKLKENFVLPKKILTQYALLSYFRLSSGKNGCNKLATEKSRDVNFNRKKYIFQTSVDYIKLMLKANIPVPVNNIEVSKKSIFVINKIHSLDSKFVKNIPNIIIRRNYGTSSKKCLPTSVGRHRYHKDTEKAVNQQILAELNAGYAYLSMACYFGRTEIALPGCHGYFMNMHYEEQEHALIFINYQLMRGAHVHLCPLTVPECEDWGDIRTALNVAVEMEKSIKEKLQELYNIAEKHQDLHVMDLITTKFMEEQERSICEISRLFTRATCMGNSGVADYLFDKEVHRTFVKKGDKDKTEDTGKKSDLYI